MGIEVDGVKQRMEDWTDPFLQKIHKAERRIDGLGVCAFGACAFGAGRSGRGVRSRG